MEDSIRSNQALIDVLNGLKQEIKGLRNDMNRIEESVLKQRLMAIQEALCQNHLIVYADQRSENIDEDLYRMLKVDCDKREKCFEYFKGKMEDSTKAIKESGSRNAISDIDNKITENELMVEKIKGKACETCFSKFQKRLRSEKRAYQEITLVEDSMKTKANGLLDIQYLIDNLLEPLTNYSRLTILVSVSEGKKSFSELSKITNTKAGHLAFHLRKLVSAKLIAQEATKGDYVVTQRGLELIKKLESLQPEKK